MGDSVHPCGLAIVRKPDGQAYFGLFIIDDATHIGTLTRGDGSVYEGAFHLGLPSGAGRLTTSDGTVRYSLIFELVMRFFFPLLRLLLRDV
jgi:hypothetical protein